MDKEKKAMIARQFGGANRKLAPAVVQVIQDLRAYYPLTVRQVYYQCVATGLIGNSQPSYVRMSKLVTNLRRKGFTSWDSIADNSRVSARTLGWSNASESGKAQLKGFLDPALYRRNRQQGQDLYIEVAVEKDALASVFRKVTDEYCVPLQVFKGQISSTELHNMSVRFDDAIVRGQQPVVLYHGDLDPSGIAIPRSTREGLYKYHGMEVEFRLCALTCEHLSIYDLETSFDNFKPRDPNVVKWEAEGYGGTPPTELDALHPKDLQPLIRNSIKSALDLKVYGEQVELEKAERKQLQEVKADIEMYARKKHSKLL